MLLNFESDIDESELGPGAPCSARRRLATGPRFPFRLLTAPALCRRNKLDGCMQEFCDRRAGCGNGAPFEPVHDFRMHVHGRFDIVGFPLRIVIYHDEKREQRHHDLLQQLRKMIARRKAPEQGLSPYAERHSPLP